MLNEKTLVMIKPDAFERNLFHKIVSLLTIQTNPLLSNCDFDVVDSGTIRLNEDDVRTFYSHVPEDIKQRLVGFMADKGMVYMVLEGEGVINRIRRLIGKTNPMKAATGTIRGTFNEGSGIIHRNLIHASDSAESFNKEYRIIRKHAFEEADKAMGILEEHYQFDDKESVKSFLRYNLKAGEFAIEAAEKFYEYFGKDIELVLIVDDEDEEYERLFAYVYTKRSVEESCAIMDKLDQEWLNVTHPDKRCLFAYNVAWREFSYNVAWRK